MLSKMKKVYTHPFPAIEHMVTGLIKTTLYIMLSKWQSVHSSIPFYCTYEYWFNYNCKLRLALNGTIP